jgi:probable HAF family extracellular repeat protein
MRANSITLVVVLGLLAPLVAPVLLAAQNIEGHVQHHHYKPIDIGTFGGPSSYLSALLDGFSSANVMNKNGTFVGWADTPAEDPFSPFCFNVLGDCHVAHALRWQDGISTDLGTLAEGWSSAATWVNNGGETIGVSQNGVIDPVVGFPEERGVLWRDGQMIDLGTLGGNQSTAGAINNHGQVAGFALNDVSDPFSFYYQAFFCQTPLNICPANATATRAFVWDEKDGMQDIGTLGGPDSLAFLVNDRGQVAGFSYTNSTVNANTGFPTFHPFLWEKGKGMKDLGTLGGTVAQAVNGLNERGEVVGSTTTAGDQTHHPFLWNGTRLMDLGTFGGPNGEADWVNDAGDVVGIAQRPTFCSDTSGGVAFLWSKGVLHDLGTSAGLENSEATFINSNGQAVGYSFSCGVSTISAFLWEQGSMVDLNTLIPASSQFYLWAAGFISDRGEIAAFGTLPSGDTHVVLLIPCDENHPSIEGCDYNKVDASAATSFRPTLREVPGNILPLVHSHRNNRFRFRPLATSGRRN